MTTTDQICAKDSKDWICSNVFAAPNGRTHKERSLYARTPFNGLTVGVLAQLANAAYEQPIPSGWRRARAFDSKLRPVGSHFHAELYVDARDNYVLGFRGTVKTSPRDWLNDLSQGIGAQSAQYQEAQELIATQLDDYVAWAKTFTFVGHSLGGGLAAAASALAPAVPTVTFNAAGLRQETRIYGSDGFDVGTRFDRFCAPSRRSGLVVNFHVVSEALTTFQDEYADHAGVVSSHRFMSVVASAAGHQQAIPRVLHKTSVELHLMEAVLESLGVTGDGSRLTWAPLESGSLHLTSADDSEDEPWLGETDGEP